MNTEKHRFRILQSAFIRVVPWLIPALLFGCKKEEIKVYPQDRLTVEYTFDRDTIHIGDPVELVVTAYYPTNGILELPEIGREKDIVLLERDWNSIPRDDGLAQSETRYLITSFRLGDHLICEEEIACRIGDGFLSAPFPPAMIHVQSSLPPEASKEIADIKPMQKLPARIPHLA